MCPATAEQLLGELLFFNYLYFVCCIDLHISDFVEVYISKNTFTGM